MNTKLYIWNMSESTTENDVRELFEQVGPVVAVAIVKDEDTGESAGLGFVEMEAKAAEKAITKFNDYPLNGRKLVVSFERPGEDRTRHFAPTAYDPKPKQE